LYSLPMLTVAVMNKGGCGKTAKRRSPRPSPPKRTCAGLRTLLVDADRQGSALDWSAARAAGSKLAGGVVFKADKALPLPRLREMAKGYDTGVLDGPPRLGDVTSAACVASDVCARHSSYGPVPSTYGPLAKRIPSSMRQTLFAPNSGAPPRGACSSTSQRPGPCSRTRPRERSRPTDRSGE
jgi:hypothetical protein